jgi:geranylgeranyl reductase family protein
MNYDVVVVGSGPAGAIVSYELAQQGVDVLILEKSKLPRYKPCGGGITQKTLNELPFEVQPVIDLQAEGCIISYRGRQFLKTDNQRNTAHLVMRDRFDHFLIQEAIKAGAQLKDSTNVTNVEINNANVRIRTNNGQFKSKFVIGADGVNSVVAQSLNLIANRETGVALEAEVNVPIVNLREQGAYATFDFGAIPNGYGWIFPKKDHFSIGVFYAKNKKLPNIKAYLHHFTKSHKILINHSMMNIRGHRIPLGGKTNKIHDKRALLIGDAANLADPWLGEGIYYAVSSAKIAAKVVYEAFEEDFERIQDYSQIVYNKIGFQLDQARIFAKITYKFPQFCTKLLHKSSNLQEVIFGIISGEYNFQQANIALRRKFPSILMQSLIR